MSADEIYVVRMILVDAKEVLLHVVCPAEHLETDIAVEGLVIFVDVLVPRVQVLAICSVRTMRTHIPLIHVAQLLVLHFVLQVL